MVLNNRTAAASHIMVVFFIVLVGRDLSTMYIKENSVKKNEVRDVGEKGTGGRSDVP